VNSDLTEYTDLLEEVLCPIRGAPRPTAGRWGLPFGLLPRAHAQLDPRAPLAPSRPLLEVSNATSPPGCGMACICWQSMVRQRVCRTPTMRGRPSVRHLKEAQFRWSASHACMMSLGVIFLSCRPASALNSASLNRFASGGVKKPSKNQLIDF